jgi:hypothetical protein
MVKRYLTGIGVFSLGKIFGATYALMGFILGAIMSLMSLLMGSVAGNEGAAVGLFGVGPISSIFDIFKLR